MRSSSFRRFVIGLLKVISTITLRAVPYRWSLVASGMVSMAVALLLHFQLPFFAVCMFGVLVGMTLVAEGIYLCCS